MADRRSQKALSEFLSEAQETIDALGKELLRLETAKGGAGRGPAAGAPGPEDLEADPAVVNAVFRYAHSLKGLSSMFGVERMSRLAHALEDLLDEVRMGRQRLDPDRLDLLLEAPELFGRILAEEASGGLRETAARAEGLATRLRATAEGQPRDPGDLSRFALGPEVLGVLTEYEEHRLRTNAARGMSLFKVKVALDLSTFDVGLAALNATLKPFGEVIATLPSTGLGDKGKIAFEVLFGSRARIERIGAAAGPAAVVTEVPRADGGASGPPPPAGPPGAAPEGLASPPGPASIPAPETAPPAASGEPHPSDGPEASIRSVSQAVRVDIHKLDRLMHAVGELLLVKTGLQHIAERLRSGEEGTSLALELHRENRSLERKLNELQAGILEVRMVPLSQVFDKLTRMVRKVSREAGKEVDLRVSGGDVELDKLIVEELSDPLMHLIRNAIDHAIEPPDERERAGKPRGGQVVLSAAQKGNHVEIRVEDDGAGIDEDRVREVAVERGLATASQVRELSHREVMNLIFVPGFSTARQVTPLSGRGVGMDVVKSNIAALSGIIDLHTERGKGTCFELTLPVTLAIVRALVVAVSGRTYAVPLNGVLEILALDPPDIRTVETREVITLRGATLPLVRLSRFFGLPAPGRPASLAWPPAKTFVVVVGLAQERLGMAVDELAGQQDIVVKPLGPALQGVRGVAGATDLGNRRTVLVLDVGAVIEDVLRAEPARGAVA
jgi:two-component system chemotaxis sensor kinase CheA